MKLQPEGDHTIDCTKCEGQMSLQFRGDYTKPKSIRVGYTCLDKGVYTIENKKKKYSRKPCDTKHFFDFIEELDGFKSDEERLEYVLSGTWR